MLYKFNHLFFSGPFTIKFSFKSSNFLSKLRISRVYTFNSLLYGRLILFCTEFKRLRLHFKVLNKFLVYVSHLYIVNNQLEDLIRERRKISRVWHSIECIETRESRLLFSFHLSIVLTLSLCLSHWDRLTPHLVEFNTCVVIWEPTIMVSLTSNIIKAATKELSRLFIIVPGWYSAKSLIN